MTLFSNQRDTNLKIQWASPPHRYLYNSEGGNLFPPVSACGGSSLSKETFHFCFAVMITEVEQNGIYKSHFFWLDVRSVFPLAFLDVNPILSERFLTFLSQILKSSFCRFIFHSFVEHFLFSKHFTFSSISSHFESCRFFFLIRFYCLVYSSI